MSSQRVVETESLLMQDEPEGDRMLVIANQNEAGAMGPETDPGVCRRQSGDEIEAAHRAEMYGRVERTLQERV